MDESVPLVPEPKTRAEYRAAIRAMLDEIRRLFAEMEGNRAEVERKRVEIEIVGARIDDNLQALEQQLEELRRSRTADAQRTG